MHQIFYGNHIFFDNAVSIETTSRPVGNANSIVIFRRRLGENRHKRYDSLLMQLVGLSIYAGSS